MRKFPLGLISLLLAFCWLASACNQANENTTTGAATPTPEVTPDSNGAKLPADSGMTPGFPSSLKDRSQLLSDALFNADFNRTDLEEIDLTTRFPSEQEMDFRRFICMKEVKNEYGSGIYPRWALLNTRFDSFEILQKDLNAYLQGLKKQEPGIVLGKEVKGVKSPPFIAAVVDGDVFFLRSACVYSGNLWEQLNEKFIGFFKEAGASWIFRVTCAEKNIEYIKKP